MRNKKAKAIKRSVISKMYGDEFLASGKEARKKRRTIYSDSKFKTIFRAAKKNYAIGNLSLK